MSGRKPEISLFKLFPVKTTKQISKYLDNGHEKQFRFCRGEQDISKSVFARVYQRHCVSIITNIDKVKQDDQKSYQVT
jgi:hypothetical protein